MQNTLYEFLILNKSVSIPRIGTISIQREPAQHDIGNKLFNSSAFNYRLDTQNDQPSKKFFAWLSAVLGVSESDAVKSLSDFSQSLKNKLSEAGEANWENVGVLRTDAAGYVRLDPAPVDLQSEMPVNAEKVIREKFEHTVLVGEQERSSVEMEEYLADTRPTRNYLWIIAIVLTVLCIMFIGWYFSEKGFTPSSAGNKSILKSN